MNQLNLFEYKWNNDIPPTLNEEHFENYLDDIWKNRPKLKNWYTEQIDEIETDNNKQRFIQFRAKEFSSRNFVGVIRYDDTEINLLPKIFYKKEFDGRKGVTLTKKEKKNIHLHILYWLSYTKKIQFPKSLTNLESIEIDSFFEILILMYATYTRDAMSQILYQNYYEVNQDNQFIKGRLDVNGYIRDNITTGNWQRITCDYDTFDIDNRFNRIIKYVSKMLLAHTKNDAIQNLLYEIIFLLDDVEDVQMTYDDCEKIKLYPFFNELNVVLDYCKLFLSNSMVFSYKEEFEVFAFLLPMEKIFEEFVAGFLDQNRKDLDIIAQKQDQYLASTNDSSVFQLIPDIYIQIKADHTKNTIVDTKYKILNQNIDLKKGVSQSDMYQVVSYAIRYKVSNIILLYPASINNHEDSGDVKYSGSPVACFTVRDELSNIKKEIHINVHKFPMMLDHDCSDYQILKKELDSKIMTATNNMFWTMMAP